MREKVLALKESHNGGYYYSLSGVGVFDLIFFFEKMNYKIHYYDDIPYCNENRLETKKLKLVHEYRITKKVKQSVNNLFALGITDYSNISRQTKISNFNSRTSVLFSCVDEKSLDSITNLSCEELYQNIKMDDNKIKLNFAIFFHDFDWRAFCYFKDCDTYNGLIDFLKEQSSFSFVDKYEQLPQ